MAERPHRPGSGVLSWFASLTDSRIGIVLTCLFMTAVSYAIFFALGAINQDNYIHTLFCRRGAIPFICTFLFFLAVSLQLRKYYRVSMEWRSFDLEKDFFPTGMESTIRKETADAIGAKIRMLPEEQRDLLLCRRMDKSLQRLRNTGSSGEMSSVLNDLSAIDRNQAESGYTVIKFLLAVIPILGFIGTVLGISLAIGGFAGAVAEVSDFTELKPKLKDVTGNLGVAFETTLVALIFSALIMLFNTIIQKREDDLLTAIDDFCITNILNRLKVGDEAMRGMEAISRDLEAVRISANERSRDLEDAFREVGEEICVWLRRSMGQSRDGGKKKTPDELHRRP